MHMRMRMHMHMHMHMRSMETACTCASSCASSCASILMLSVCEPPADESRYVDSEQAVDLETTQYEELATHNQREQRHVASKGEPAGRARWMPSFHSSGWFSSLTFDSNAQTATTKVHV